MYDQKLVVSPCHAWLWLCNRRLSVCRENLDQSIVISGESGAGKTVTAKLAMRYFAIAAGSSSETQVEKRVLASSPILEVTFPASLVGGRGNFDDRFIDHHHWWRDQDHWARLRLLQAIGNAKTTRNDNSSRFGKYSELGFDNNFEILGAGMRTYLLEKSRVVFQAEAERNYHIFYQLCAASKLPEMAYLQLRDQSEYFYTRQGNCPLVKSIDDSVEFKETLKSLDLLGFPKDLQVEFFSIIAAVLHCGNIAFEDSAKDNCQIPTNDPAINSFCSLLGLDAQATEDMRKYFCNREIISMREVFIKPMTSAEAGHARNALAKHIYALLFSTMVELINKCLGSEIKPNRFIGVLDIYGFETFLFNSFEQFCINYANEKLQQQFNHHVFKLEQEEYVREKIVWNFIDYYDNQPCIDLIEKPLGIFDLLDEECRVPKGTDQSWVEKLYDKCKKYPHFVKPRLNNAGFIIVHFADRVEYQAAGFVEKNRDTVMEEQIQVLRKSTNKLLLQLVKKKEEPAEGGKSSSKKRQTVGSQFRDSLVMLVDTLNSTTPHYIRCIKPNDQKARYNLNNTRTAQQLRACGVLETVRISSAGFPSRQSYEDFAVRYRVLFKDKNFKKEELHEKCKELLRENVSDEDKFKFGITKIFFRAGTVAFMEKRRSDKLLAYGIILQTMVRGWHFRNEYVNLRRLLMVGQCLSRGYLARSRLQAKREQRASIIIQKSARMFVQRTKYLVNIETAKEMQKFARGALSRKRFAVVARNAKLVSVQNMVRGYLERKHYQRFRKSALILQSCFRRWMATKEQSKLRKEAGEIVQIKKLNKGLENKIISLQQYIDEMNKELMELRDVQKQFDSLRIEFDLSRKRVSELEASTSHLADMEVNIKALKDQLEQEEGDKSALKNELEKVENAKFNLENQVASIQRELTVTQAKTHAKLLEAEQTTKRKLDQERAMLFQEMEQERGAYQKLMLSYRQLEEEMENLKVEGGGSTNSVDPTTEAIMAQQTLDIQQLKEDLESEKMISKQASTELHRLRSDSHG